MTTSANCSASPDTIRAVAERASRASRRLSITSAETRNAILTTLAARLESSLPAILSANAEDVRDAHIAVQQGVLTSALVDRLILDASKVRGMITSIHAVVALDDPLHRTVYETRLDEGLELQQRTVPFGVIAAIFEARPDAVTQIAALALKSGNAVILKGGREASRSTHALVRCIRDAIDAVSPSLVDAVVAVDGRDTVSALLAMDDLVDLVIPRGSHALVREIQSNTRIPVLGHAAGICHVYLHGSANPDMAANIVFDSKTQYPAACNAAETLLVDTSIAEQLLPLVMDRLVSAGVEIRCCVRTIAALGIPHVEGKRSDISGIIAATDDDWNTEHSALILNCKLVDAIDDAIAHIHAHGSRHTETIVAEDAEAASHFLATVDAASVFHNTSTRFADGYRYGLGAEVGISTNKVHARGPVGLQGLTTTKYLLRGQGHVVTSYTGPNAKRFLHIRK